MLANRIFTREILLRKRFADDDFVRFVEALAGIKNLSPQQRNPQRPKITWISPPNDRVLALPLRKRRMFRDPETAVPAVALSGNESDQSCRLDPRQGAHALQQRFIKSYALRVMTILCFRQAKTHGEHIICDTAEFGGA